MTNHDDDSHTHHAPGSQPSVRPGSDEPQTVPVPTPPVAWDSEPTDPADRTDDEAEEERTAAHKDPKTTSRDE
ncbi:hypothetical protein ACH4Y0_19805 [Streptomyces sp. NPDC020707]|uniref:Uncharacterized protein n=1 Tax=Streptomyces ortus TaxID=2867268 RepID=A0ABT3VFE2_9ACTN|nr:hypothetical protein [Streptomyces ortus]MCX4238662.1 hypothetical protein [Streptomyces ortus]